MLTPRQLLVRGLLAGLVAGVLAFAFAFVVGEPPLRTAIALEQADHSQAPDHGDVLPVDGAGSGTPAVVPRSLQSTLGLLSATAVTGVALGGVLGVLSALALGRFGRLQIRGTVLLVAGTGFLAVVVTPFLIYPPNPPGVGEPATLTYRTTLYAAALAISLIAGVTALLVARHLARRWGAWYAAVAAGTGYLVVTVVAGQLLPRCDEVPAAFPATVLYAFRAASFLTQLTLWATLALVLAELGHRLTRRAGSAAGGSRLVEVAG